VSKKVGDRECKGNHSREEGKKKLRHSDVSGRGNKDGK